MTATRPSLTLETTLYLALLGVALFLRLNQLGEAPLSDPEAAEALTALRFVRGQPELGVPNSPAYFFFTALAFLVLPIDNGTARLAPALFGALLTVTPWLYRRWLGRGTALVVSGLLAISSGLIAASRSADGAMITLTAWLISLALAGRFWEGGRPAWLIGAAVLAGMALAGGGAGLTGLLLLAVALLAARRAVAAAWAEGGLRERLTANRWPALIALGLSLLVVATFALTYRSGLGALAGSWLAWLAGFAPTAAGRSLLTAPVFLLVYEPLLLIGGLLGLGRAFRQGGVALVVGAFAMLAALFVLFYAGRSLFDLAWLLVALAVLAAHLLTGLLHAYFQPEEWPLVGALAGIVLALWGFAQINLTRFAEQLRFNPALFAGADLPWNSLAGLLLAGLALAAAALVTYLFGIGWSMRAAVAGATLSAVFALGATTLGAGWGLAQLRPTEPTELWWPRPAAEDLNRLVATLRTTSNFAVGQEHEVEVVVHLAREAAVGALPVSAEAALLEAQNSALAWALRDFPKARFVAELDALVSAPVVIASATEENPTLGSAYLGQAFSWRRAWRPENLLEGEQLQWLLTRQAPTETAILVLWVRQDIQQLPTVQTP